MVILYVNLSPLNTHMKSKIAINGNFLVYVAHIGALLTVTFWATSFLSTKVLMESGGFTPVEMYVYRFTGAYLLLFLITFKKIMSDSWRDELTFLLSGICSGSLYFITENIALQLTKAGNVSLLASISPMFTTLLMAVVFKQKLKPGVIIGSGIAILGVGCIILGNGESLELRPTGDLLAIAAAMCWAIYTIAIRRVIPTYTTLFITRKLFFYGVITALPILLIQMQSEPSHLSLLFDINRPRYFFNFMFLVLCCSVLAYIIWNEAMKILGAVTANNYLYLQPPITMVAGSFFLGEHVFMMGVLGCILVIVGLIISDKWKGSIWFNRK